MRSSVVYHAVDSHTEGMPTRVITGGVGVLPGATMFERRQRFVAERDDLRTLLMCEPRGHAAEQHRSHEHVDLAAEPLRHLRGIARGDLENAANLR